jgi:hypothetical protein
VFNVVVVMYTICRCARCDVRLAVTILTLAETTTMKIFTATSCQSSAATDIKYKTARLRARQAKPGQLVLDAVRSIERAETIVQAAGTESIAGASKETKPWAAG